MLLALRLRANSMSMRRMNETQSLSPHSDCLRLHFRLALVRLLQFLPVALQLLQVPARGRAGCG